MTRKLLRALTASLGVMLTAIVMFIASPAMATPAAPELGNIDFDHQGTLTIHKYENPEWTGQSTDGKPIADVPGTAVAMNGIKFKVEKTTLDLKNPETWTKLKDHYANVDGVAVDSSFSAVEKVTEGKGEAKFDGLKPGVYKVTEVDSDAYDQANPTKKVQAKAAPFLITLPVPNGAQGWLYDVHAYPKNTVADKPTKEVDDSAAFNSDDVVKWTVKFKIPQTGSGDELKSLIVKDSFDERLSDVAIESVSIGSTALTGDEFTSQVTPNEQTKKTDTLVTLTPAGIEKAKAAVGQELIVVYTSKATGVGVIPNQALVYVNDPNLEHDGIPTNEPSTPWGTVRIVKQDKNTHKPLEGAEFSIRVKETGKEVAEGLVTGADGTVKFNLKADVIYELVETKAPAGYKKIADPVEFTLKKDADGQTVAEVVLTVDNEPVDTPPLPVTGAQGQLMMAIGGLVILMLAGGISLRVVSKSRS